MILVCSKNVTEETDRLKVVKGYTQNQVLEAIYLHAATCLCLAQAYMTKPKMLLAYGMEDVCIILALAIGINQIGQHAGRILRSPSLVVGVVTWSKFSSLIS